MGRTGAGIARLASAARAPFDLEGSSFGLETRSRQRFPLHLDFPSGASRESFVHVAEGRGVENPFTPGRPERSAVEIYPAMLMGAESPSSRAQVLKAP